MECIVQKNGQFVNAGLQTINKSDIRGYTFIRYFFFLPNFAQNFTINPVNFLGSEKYSVP